MPLRIGRPRCVRPCVAGRVLRAQQQSHWCNGNFRQRGGHHHRRGGPGRDGRVITMTETANWAWQARDGDGELRRGTIAAESAAEVASRLRSEGRIVIAIDRSVVNPRSNEGRFLNLPGRVDREATASMIRRLSVMLEAGVPLPGVGKRCMCSARVLCRIRRGRTSGTTRAGSVRAIASLT